MTDTQFFMDLPPERTQREPWLARGTTRAGQAAAWFLRRGGPWGGAFGTARAPASERRSTASGRTWLTIVALACAALCLLPIAAVALEALSGWLTGDTGTVTRLGATLLPGYAAATLRIAGLVAVGTLVIGTGAAWLVTACAFPGRRVLEIALVVPLAFPAYVLAYAYTDLLDHPGAVQSALRALMGWGPRDYWFPEIRSEGGAALMLTLVLYPYVYLLARAALLMQGLLPFTVARGLGCAPFAAFRQVALPMIAPAIAGGVLLVTMETIADFGTVAHFGVQTLATGIYTAWFTLGDRTAAAQIALGLLAIALLLVGLERLRAGADTAQVNGDTAAPRMRLSGPAAWSAAFACALPVLLGAVVPLVMLLHLAARSDQDWLGARYLGFLSNSLTLAGIAALVTVAAAIALSAYRRASGGRTARGALNVARLGYAVPGGVIAVGLFVPFAGLDNTLDAWARETLGVSTGLLVSGSIALLVMAYAIRFMSPAIGAWRAGEATLSVDMDRAAAGLGGTPFHVLSRIHVPLLTPAALTALLVVFVDTMKELPATLIVRPFGWDTLAVQAYRLAADERLEGAAVPSLAIVAVGLIPVVLLCRRIGASR